MVNYGRLDFAFIIGVGDLAKSITKLSIRMIGIIQLAPFNTLRVFG